MVICLLVYIICIIVLLESPVAYGNNMIMFQTVGIPLSSFLWIIWSTMYGLDFVAQLYVKDGVYLKVYIHISIHMCGMYCKGYLLHGYQIMHKTFKSASKEICSITCFTEVQTNWKFKVAKALWWGGFWEYMVQSMKID